MCLAVVIIASVATPSGFYRVGCHGAKRTDLAVELVPVAQRDNRDSWRYEYPNPNQHFHRRLPFCVGKTDTSQPRANRKHNRTRECSAATKGVRCLNESSTAGDRPARSSIAGKTEARKAEHEHGPS
jgi:hypothetical protein